jgi:hypothetical protein
MRVIATELRKIFSNKIFLLIIAVVFIMNAYLMFRTANSDDAKPSDYKSIYSELEGLSDSDKLAVFDERINNSTQGLYDYNWELYYELANECYDIVNYKSYLENIETQAESMKNISIFSNSDTFNYRSIVKTPSAYKNVQEVQPLFDVSQGIILATDNNFTDVFIGFILLFTVLSVMISDREQGMSGLLFVLKRGRNYLFFMKLMVLAITVFSVVSLIYLENLVISSYIYGLGDLSRPVQSLNGFIGCNLPINVFAYLLIYIVFKSAAMFGIVALLSLIAILSKNTVTLYGISAFVLVIEGLLYQLIHPLSVYSIFKYINLIAFTKVNEIFCNYKNINFWEYPISLIPASISAVIILVLICCILGTVLYGKKRNLEFKKIGLKFKHNKNSKVHSAIYYTFFKSLAQQKGSIVIAVCVFLTLFLNVGFKKEYDIVDVYYKYYTELLEGEIDDDTVEFMFNEDNRFQELSAQIENLSQSTTGFSAELNELQKEYVPSTGFYLLKERYDEVKSIENAHIFYDTGYQRMLGKQGYDDDMKYALASVLLCIFLISPLIANDNQYRMYSIINATKSGRKSYIKRNSKVAVMYGLLSVLLWIVPYCITIGQYYGYRCLNAPIQSIADYKNIPISFTVMEYLVVIFTLRIIFVILSALMMLEISSKSKNTTAAVLINFSIFALPVIIYLLGAKFMVNIGFSPLLSVNVLINEPSFIHWIVPMIVIVLEIAYFIRKSKNNANKN